MDQITRHFVIDRTHDLIAAFSCAPETKAAAQKWLSAAGTAAEAEETRRYLSELEGDIMPLDRLIAFASSPEGQGYFGREKAGEIADHAREIKAAGATYCDCPACAAAEAILKVKDQLLA